MKQGRPDENLLRLIMEFPCRCRPKINKLSLGVGGKTSDYRCTNALSDEPCTDLASSISSSCDDRSLWIEATTCV